MWSREETDQLFELCERFDLRFIIIADRFPSSRTVEDLKNRYYSGIGLSLVDYRVFLISCFIFMHSFFSLDN